jgi:hypothetical protein
MSLIHIQPFRRPEEGAGRPKNWTVLLFDLLVILMPSTTTS